MKKREEGNHEREVNVEQRQKMERSTDGEEKVIRNKAEHTTYWVSIKKYIWSILKTIHHSIPDKQKKD